MLVVSGKLATFYFQPMNFGILNRIAPLFLFESIIPALEGLGGTSIKTALRTKSYFRSLR